MSGESVLVTGGSGFVASRCLIRLLEQGCRVRTTVRSDARADDVRALIASGENQTTDTMDRLAFTVADLTSDDGWEHAAAGCDYVLHVASPFPPSDPEDEDDLIVDDEPGRGGRTVPGLRG